MSVLNEGVNNSNDVTEMANIVNENYEALLTIDPEIFPDKIINTVTYMTCINVTSKWIKNNLRAYDQKNNPYTTPDAC